MDEYHAVVTTRMAELERTDRRRHVYEFNY